MILFVPHLNFNICKSFFKIYQKRRKGVQNLCNWSFGPQEAALRKHVSGWRGRGMCWRVIVIVCRLRLKQHALIEKKIKHIWMFNYAKWQKSKQCELNLANNRMRLYEIKVIQSLALNRGNKTTKIIPKQFANPNSWIEFGKNAFWCEQSKIRTKIMKYKLTQVGVKWLCLVVFEKVFIFSVDYSVTESGWKNDMFLCVEQEEGDGTPQWRVRMVMVHSTTTQPWPINSGGTRSQSGRPLWTVRAFWLSSSWSVFLAVRCFTLWMN